MTDPRPLDYAPPAPPTEQRLTQCLDALLDTYHFFNDGMLMHVESLTKKGRDSLKRNFTLRLQELAQQLRFFEQYAPNDVLHHYDNGVNVTYEDLRSTYVLTLHTVEIIFNMADGGQYDVTEFQDRPIDLPGVDDAMVESPPSLSDRLQTFNAAGDSYLPDWLVIYTAHTLSLDDKYRDKGFTAAQRYDHLEDYYAKLITKLPTGEVRRTMSLLVQELISKYARQAALGMDDAAVTRTDLNDLLDRLILEWNNTLPPVARKYTQIQQRLDDIVALFQQYEQNQSLAN